MTIKSFEISVTSQGSNAGEDQAKAIITKNGEVCLTSTSGTGRGLNVVVFDEYSGAVIDKKIFDVWDSDDAAIAFADFVKGVRTGDIVAVAICDEGTKYITGKSSWHGKRNEAAIAACKTIGSTQVENLQWRDSWALIGCKGEGALKEVLSSSGAATISATVDPHERIKQELERAHESLKADPSAGFHVVDISTSHPADSYLSTKLRQNTLGGEDTRNIANEMVRQAKFMKDVLSTDFDKLNTTKDDHGNVYTTAVQQIDGFQYSFYIPHSEAMALQLSEVSVSDIAETASKYKIDPASTHISINNKNYSVKMNVPMYFNRGDEKNAIIHVGLQLFGSPILGALIAKLFMKLGEGFLMSIKNMFSLEILGTAVRLLLFPIRFAFSFLVSFIARLILGDSVITALGAAGAHALASAVSGITRAAVARLAALTIATVGVAVFLTLAPHSSHQIVHVYNLTDYDLSLSIPYLDYGKPFGIKPEEPCYIPAKTTSKTGPIPLGSAYNAQTFGFSSDGEWNGLGYVLELKLSKEGQTSIPAFCLFDIPWMGDNSLAGTFNTIGTEDGKYKKFYKDQSGKQKVTQYVTKGGGGKIEMILTYDFLSGKHTDSQTGQDVHIYNSLLVLRDAES